MGAYKASAFGFVIFEDKKLRLLSPVVISKDKISAYFYIHPTKFKKIPKYQDIQEWARNYDIMALRTEAEITEELQKIDIEAKTEGRFLSKLNTLKSPKFIAEHLKATVQTKEKIKK